MFAYRSGGDTDVTSSTNTPLSIALTDMSVVNLILEIQAVILLYRKKNC